MALSNRSYAKYHGLGNDFILVDNTTTAVLMYTMEQVMVLCNRNFGIGADGLIFALPGLNGCDYTMRIFNSDGTEPQMCGNGIRCLAKYIHRLNSKASNEVGEYKVWTNAGVIVPTILADGTVRVDMGEPTLLPAKIPTTLSAGVTTYSSLPENPSIKSCAVVETELRVMINDAEEEYTLRTTPIGMGNPHTVSNALPIMPHTNDKKRNIAWTDVLTTNNKTPIGYFCRQPRHHEPNFFGPGPSCGRLHTCISRESQCRVCAGRCNKI